MIRASIFPGRYTQGAGALSNLRKKANRFGKKHLHFVTPLQWTQFFQNTEKTLRRKLKLNLKNLTENFQAKKKK